MKLSRVRTRWQERRQARYPAEFRIAPPLWPPDVHAELDRIAGLLARPATPAPDPAGDDDEALADAVIGLWRAQRRVEHAEPEDESRLTRQLRRHVDTAWRGLAEIGLTVHVHDGEPYDDGLALEALAKQPEPGMARETVIETVQPTILRAGRVIRFGQVIVGYPEGTNGT